MISWGIYYFIELLEGSENDFVGNYYFIELLEGSPKITIDIESSLSSSRFL